ncbi:MCE family protein [Amycolatopsis albispora]|uniref:ABC transporter substrate-binding protein n=1 Tax=Amycolatopsis albispora TaxID=1804986 RepID=A0A344L524_9PSEU|nr:MCE family protein [Amycolatopsis albispora]AXB43148.1 hypothetical protein A4R43_11785 [Amycolatopsis albispora]
MRRLCCLAVLTLVSGCGVGFQDLPLGRTPDGDSYRLTLVFADAAGLPVGGKVKLGQAEVGRVSELRARDFRAEVVVAISAGVPLPAGTRAQIQVSSALGEQFVDLQPPPGPAAGTLADGGVIGVELTSGGPAVEDLLAAAGTMLNGAGLDQVRTIVAEANTALGGRSAQVKELFGQLDSLLASVDAHRGELTRAIDSVGALTTTVNDERATIEAGLTRLTPAIEVLNGHRGTLENLLGRVTTLSRVTGEALGKTEQDLLALVPQVRQLLGELGGLDTELGATLAKIAPFQENLARATPSDYLNVDGRLDVPNTLLPLLTGSPPPPPGSAPEPGALADFLARSAR